MKKKLILIFLISTIVHAQKNRVIDSLKIEISKKQTDINLIEKLLQSIKRIFV